MTRVVLTLDGVTKDLTDLDGYNILQKGSVYVDRPLHGPDFAPAIGTAEWQILWSTDILTWVDGREDDTLVQVLDGTTPLFTGYLRPTTSAPLEGPADKIKMEALDTTVLLETTVEEAETRWLWTDAMKVAMASGTNSMVHEYLKRTRLWTGSAWKFPVQAPDRDIVIPMISIARGDEAKTRLDKMCSQFGLSYYALEDGTIKFFRWDLPNPASELTIGQAGIHRKLSTDRKDPKEKGVIVQFQKYKDSNEVETFVAGSLGGLKINASNHASKVYDTVATRPSSCPSDDFGLVDPFLELDFSVQGTATVNIHKLPDPIYGIPLVPPPGGPTIIVGGVMTYCLSLDGLTEWGSLGVGPWSRAMVDLGPTYPIKTSITEYSYNQRTREFHIKIDGSVGGIRSYVDATPGAYFKLHAVRLKGKFRYYEHLESTKANPETDDEAAPRFRTHPATTKKLSKEITVDLVTDRSVAESTAWARYHAMIATTMKASMLTSVALGQVVTIDVPMKGFSSLARVVSLRTNPGGKALPEVSFESLVPVTLVHVPLPIEPTAGDLRRSPDQIAIEQALEVALDPNAVTTIDRRYKRAATKPETPLDDEPENWVGSAYDGDGTLWMIEGPRNRDGQLINGWADPAQADGPPGKTYLLTITGGTRSHTWDATGANPNAASAFGVELLEDGVAVTPTAYSWTTPAAGLLSGAGTEATFTPGVAASWDAAKTDNWVACVVTFGGVQYQAKVPVAVSRVGSTGATGAPGPQGIQGVPGTPAPRLKTQYSADASSWHTGFQSGDKYIRTSVDDGATWEPAAKFVGEDGLDGQDGQDGAPGAKGDPGDIPTTFSWVKDSLVTVLSGGNIRGDGGPSGWGQARKFRSTAAFPEAFASAKVRHDVSGGFGLDADPQLSTTWQNYDIWWYHNGAHCYPVFQGDDYTSPRVTYTDDDTLSVTYDGVTARWFRNGTEVYSRTMSLGNLYFFADQDTPSGIVAYDVRFGATGRRGDLGPAGPIGQTGPQGISGPQGVPGDRGPLGPGMWTPNLFGGVTQINGTTFRNTGDTGAGYSNGFYSAEGYDSVSLKFQFETASGECWLGLSESPRSDAEAYLNAKYWWIDGDKNAHIHFEGTPVSEWHGVVTAQTKFGITYDGAYLRFYKDNVLKYQHAIAGKTFKLTCGMAGLNAGVWGVNFGKMLVGSELLANSVTANEIAAGAISADKLTIGTLSDNLIVNGNFEDGQVGFMAKHADNVGTATVGDGFGISGTKGLRLSGLRECISFMAVPVTPGEKYAIKFSYKADTAGIYLIIYAGLSGGRPADGYIGYPDAPLWAGIPSFGTNPGAGYFQAPNTGWNEAMGDYEIPAGCYWMSLAIHAPWGVDTTVYIDKVTMRRQIVGVELRDGVVTAQKIQAEAVQATHIKAGAVEASHIAANAVTAAKVAAGAISTDKLAVTARGRALNADPYCSDATAWSNYMGNGFVVENVGNQGVEGIWALKANHCHIESRWFPVTYQKKYAARAWFKRDGTANGLAYLRFYWYDANTNYITFTDAPQNSTVPGTGWSQWSIAQVSPPAGAVYASVMVILAWTGTGYQWAQGVVVEEVVQGVIIEDGTITAGKIAAGQITTDKLNVADVFGVNAEFKGKLTGAYGALGSLASARLNSDIPNWDANTHNDTIVSWISSYCTVAGYYGTNAVVDGVAVGAFYVIPGVSVALVSTTGSWFWGGAGIVSNSSPNGHSWSLTSVFQAAEARSDLLPLKDAAESLGSSAKRWKTVDAYSVHAQSGFKGFTNANAFFDGIKESSSNASGGYIKFSDGNMICWGVTGALTSGAWADVPYPSSMVYASGYPPIVLGIPRADSASGVQFRHHPISSNENTFRVLGVGTPLQWVAFGRWY